MELKELKKKIEPLFATRNIPSPLEDGAKSIRAAILEAPYFEHYKEFKAYIMKQTEIQEEIFDTIMPLLLTNAEDCSDIAKVYKYLKNYIGEIVQ